jgi:capsular exopolysaccharide synthesis family protein
MNTKNRSSHTTRDFFMIIFKHKKAAVLFWVLCIGLTGLITLVSPPVYEAETKILVKRSAPADGGDSTSFTAEIIGGRFLIEKAVQALGPEQLFPDLTGADKSALSAAVQRVQANLTVKPGTVIEIRYRHRSATGAAGTLNTLVEMFLDHYMTVQQENQTYAFFKEQRRLMEDRLNESQKQLGLFRNEHNISSIHKQKTLLLLQISDLELELAKIRGEISEFESKAADLAPTSSNRRNVLQTIIALQSREKKLSQQITEYRLQLGRLDKAETQLSELERQVRMDEENYLLYAKKTEEARISSAMDAQTLIHFAVLEPAMVPPAPVHTRTYGYLLAAVVIGALGGLLLAFTAEYFSHTFDRPEDLQTIMQCEATASFHEHDAGERTALQSQQVPRHIREECRRMVNRLTGAAPAGALKTVVFTAATHGEGTTGILTATAITLAGEGRSVLMIDTNLRTPGLHIRFRQERSTGLAEALADTSRSEACIRDTSVENLKIMSAGAPEDNPASLLRSGAFETLLQQLGRRFDWILLDSPPLNLFDDACIIAPRTDGALMVIQAGKTRWEVAVSAANRLRQSNARMLGAVLNRTRMHIPAWLYKRL